MFSSSATADVITLNVEPGSYNSWTDLFFHIFWISVLLSASERLLYTFDKDSFGVKGSFKL